MKTRYNPTEEILNAICALDVGKHYEVKFENRQPAIYTEYIIELIKTDPACEWITDAETGELIYYR